VLQHCLRYAATGTLLCAAALTGWGQQAPKPGDDFDTQAARGTVVGRVTCRDDPSQSYALYLPSEYSPERAWPIMFAFDPLGRGKTAVEIYKDAAEKYGYIVVGSNNSRNGPSARQLEAAQAVWLDTHRRFTIDKNRVYTTGLSGGARVATAFALYCYTCHVAGVIAQGAAYPTMDGSKPPPNVQFVYYAIVGDADLNYPEIVALRRKKTDSGEPSKTKIYPGPHQWAPPQIVEEGMAWLELKAMQAGTKKVDPPFVDKMFDKTQTEATEAERRGDALGQYYALRSLTEDFKGLEDVTAFAGKLAEVKASKALKVQEHDQQREIQEQAQLTATVAGELAQFGGASVRAPAGPGQFGAAGDTAESSGGQHIVSVMSDYRRRANSTSRDHLIYARAFSQLLVQGMEAGQDALRENHVSLAIAYFELMSEANPDQAWPLLALAKARVRAGDKKAAVKALEQAVHHGLKSAQTLTEDPELEPLASDPEFQRIVATLKAQ
jgi:dienelactone hydrolase